MISSGRKKKYDWCVLKTFSACVFLLAVHRMYCGLKNDGDSQEIENKEKTTLLILKNLL